MAEAIAAVYRGDAESDPLNRLVITAGLDRGQVAILRAYRKYRQRIGSRFTEGYQNDVLVANSPITAKLVRYFELRFDPDIEPDEAAEAELREEILADLENVASIDHDRILRNQLGAIDATLRTSAYKEGRGATAFKLRSADVPAIPMPAPEFEIYVYAPDIEGIHLRGGKIARGGIRFSDRMDYRTEVYGLMRAQLTKNAIIVPAGAKGGFIVKTTAIDKEAIEESYVTYIRSLLDVTDNLVDGEVVHPERVRVRDEDDTYLVVAADKGTATFSDTANAIAREYGFWLDDAFASGGSVGYDHKKLGITARGAWESVKRHFRELGMDPARDEFTVVGIGDMSGDVFGNGMLLSDKIKLLAAYDHRHVFIDPDPDPATSFAERKRLFDKPGSSWADYSVAVRGRRRLPARRQVDRALRPRARAARHRRERASAPNDVIRAILRAQVDLLWNGGIGTVVKASTESDADAADRASDAIRVDARDLRCRVVGEGGNLGFTRRARVEYSAGGGLINADFIDNSAGVDCSDHEVNLKILLGLAERRGEMTRAERDELLEAVTEDVVEHVLYDSFLQAQIIAQEVGRAPGRIFAYEDLVEPARGDRAARPREREPAGQRGADRAAPRRARDGAAGAGGPARLRQDLGRALAGGAAASPTTRGSSATCAPTSRRAVVERCGHLLGRAPAAHAADLHAQRELGRQRARPDVRLAGGGRARGRRRLRGARVPDRGRGDRRRPAVGGDRGARERRPRRAARAAGRHRRAGRGDRPLVPRPGRRARRSRRRSPPAATASSAWPPCCPQLGTEERRAPARGDRRAADRRGRARGGGDRPRAASRARPRARHGRRRRGHRALDRGRRASLLRRSAPSSGSTGWSASSPACARRRACSAGRCRPCARTPSRRAASSPSARCARARAPSRSSPSSSSCTTTPAQAARLDNFLRALAREGESDLAGLALAVRQLGAVVSS